MHTYNVYLLHIVPSTKGSGLHSQKHDNDINLYVIKLKKENLV